MNRSGQSLVELLVAIAVGVILFVGTATLVAPSLQINKSTSQVQTAAAFGEELSNNIRVFSEGGWINFLNLSTSSAYTYYLNTSSSPFTVASGTQSLAVSTTTYTRYFYLSDVYRDSNGNATSTSSGNTYDPSTKQVSVIYNWTRGATTTITFYLTRNHTNVFDQTDWSGGSGFSGPTTSPNAEFASSTSINSTSSPGSIFTAIPTTSYGYSYYRTITVTSTGSIASGTNVNFPMLVSSTVSSWEPVADGGHIQKLCTAPNGGQEPCDLVFATSTTNCGTSNLNFETESYTSSTGALVDWVNVPSVSAGTAIYACYGNTAVTTDQSHPSSTWNANYQGVFHFVSASTTIDSTANQNNGAIAGSVSATSSGEIDGAIGVPASSYMQTSAGNSFSNNFTLSAWAKMSAVGQYGGVIGDFTTGIFLGDDQSGYAFAKGPNSNQTTAISVTGAWHYFTLSLSSVTGQILYIDGSPVATSAGSTGGQAVTTALGIGSADTSYTGVGTIDEAHIVNAVLTPSWILTEYNNQSSPNTFYSLGNETNLSVAGPTGGTISSGTGQYWAWNDAIGWLNFYPSSTVSSTGLHGYATSSIGDISFDCATTRNGNICGSTSSTFSNGYLYRRTITVSTTLVSPSGTALTNFPMLISNTYSFLAASSSVSASGTLQNPNGYDIIFTSDASGTVPLSYERENYTSSTGAANFWVRVPTLSSSSNVIYLFYDATSTNADQSHPSSTWNSNYQGVWHLGNGTSLNTNDSTGLESTVNDGATAGTGEIGGGALFNGSTQYVDVPMTITYPTLTVEAWFNSSNLSNSNSRIVANSHTDIDDKGFQLMFNSGGTTGFFDVGNGSINSTAQWTYTLAPNTWYDYVGTYDGTYTRAYMNGNLIAISTSTSGSIAASGVDFNIGRDAAYTSDYLQGSVDEVRISNTARSSDWIKTEYNNESNPTNFYSIGSATQNTNGSNYQVLNDGYGDLSGWAWNDEIGWISFCGGLSTANCPGTVNYQTTIDSSGNFQGWSWNPIIGWISFNCDNNGSCGTSNYEVKTTWTSVASSTIGSLTSPIFDTGDTTGAQFNSILWQGSQVSGSTVQFQIAVSNSSGGPWTYIGSDGTSNTYYTPSGPGNAVSLNDRTFSGYRYFRYQIFITAVASSSIVKDVVVNWSP